MQAAQITRTVANGVAYMTTEYRGTEYTLRRGSFGWELTTRRLSLGRWNMGGFKRFETLADVQANCKAFAAVDLVEAL
jgi:hypothetical protein